MPSSFVEFKVLDANWCSTRWLLMSNCDSDRKMRVEIAEIMNWYFIPVDLYVVIAAILPRSFRCDALVFLCRVCDFPCCDAQYACCARMLCLSQLYQTTRTIWLVESVAWRGGAKRLYRGMTTDSFHRNSVSNSDSLPFLGWKQLQNYIIWDNGNDFVIADEKETFFSFNILRVWRMT